MPDEHDGDFEDLTVRDLFALSPDQCELAAGIAAEDFQDVQKEISSLPKPIPWSRVQEEVASIIPALLDDRLLEAWAQAWETYQRLKDDAEQSRKSPNTVVLSSVSEHSVESTWHPYVEIFLGSKKIRRITFDVTLTTQLRGLVLGLKNGRIVSLQFAQCVWTGTIALQGGAVLMQRELKKLDLPGRVTIKRGISLVPGNVTAARKIPISPE